MEDREKNLVWAVIGCKREKGIVSRLAEREAEMLRRWEDGQKGCRMSKGGCPHAGQGSSQQHGQRTRRNDRSKAERPGVGGGGR